MGAVSRREYPDHRSPLAPKAPTTSAESGEGGAVAVEALLLHDEDGTELRGRGAGPDAATAFTAALVSAGSTCGWRRA